VNLGLSGKSVIVTGGGSNIGRAIALGFAAEGARLTIADLDLDSAGRVAEAALKTGAQQAQAICTDVTRVEDCERLIAEVEQRCGSVDVLVNNVGWTIDALFLEKSRETWEKEIQLNFWSVINCTRSVVEGMIRRGGGVIVNIGSDAGRMGEYREVVYAGAKGGVIAMTKSLARELGRSNIRLNVICPGTTMPASDDETNENSIWRTQQLRSWNTDEMKARIAKAYPLRRVGRSEDIANAVVFIASDAASFITGQTLSVSGGYTMM